MDAEDERRGLHDDDGSPNQSCPGPQCGKDARDTKDGVGNGYLDPKSSKGDKRQNEELGRLKGNEKLKGEYDDEALEANGRKPNYHRNSSSESEGEKYRMSRSSPSHDRYRSRSRSSGHTRDRSRSRSIVDEYAHSKRRHSREQGSLHYTGRDKTDFDLDEERLRACGRERGRGIIDLAVDDRRERSTRYHSREAQDRDRSRDSQVDRDLYREKKREEASRNREVDWVRRTEKECERSYERDKRDVVKDRSRERDEDRDRRREMERGRSWETDFERDRRRGKERDRSRDRTRRDRDWESERDDKNWERDSIKERERERERRDDRYRHADRDTANSKGKHLRHEDGDDNRDRYRKHPRHEETEYHRERKRNSRVSTTEEDESKLERYFTIYKILLLVWFLLYRYNFSPLYSLWNDIIFLI